MKNKNLEDIQYSYPRLNKVKDYFLIQNNLKEVDLENVKLVACQHLLEPQKKMFEFFLECGIKPENIFLLGKIYSTNFEVLSELQDLGINTIQPEFDYDVSFDDQHERNCREIFQLAKIDERDQLIILDDGAQLLKIAHELGFDHCIGIEQTSSGFRKLEKESLSFPIYNVARSGMKLEEETPFIVALGLERIEEKKIEWNLKNPRVLVVGLGPIGRGMVEVLKKDHQDVFDYEREHGEQDLLQMIIDQQIDLVIGATGSQIISHDELLKLDSLLQKNVYFVSMSSSDREFEVWKLRGISNQEKKIHADIIYNHIIVTSNGFPITFKGLRYESLPEEMEQTICLLFAGVILGITEKNVNRGFIDVPQGIIEIIHGLS